MTTPINGAPSAPAVAPVVMDKATQELIRATREKVGAAGLSLVNAAPHFGLAWAKMKPRANVPGKTRGGTWEISHDGVLYADAEWTKKLDIGGAVFVLAHEILHVLLGHFDRMVELGLATPDGKACHGKEKELQTWGQSTDMAINHALKHDKVGTAPAGALFPPDEYIATNGPITAEAIYYWLLKNPQHAPPQPAPGQAPAPGAGCLPLPPQNAQGQGPQGPQQGPGAPSPGQGPQGPQPGPQGAPQDTSAGPDWTQVKREVEALARQAGLGSSVAELIKPRPARTNYRAILKAGFEAVSAEAEERSITTYSRLARRPPPVGEENAFIRPGKIGTDGTIAVVIDVSGSVSRGLVAKAAGETLSLCAEFPNVKVIFVTHTDSVVWSGVLKDGGDADAVAKATAFSGGTCALPAYVRVGELAGTKSRPGKVDSMVHFTDCELFEESWPTAPANHLVIGECGEAATRGAGTERPAKARKIPVLE